MKIRNAITTLGKDLLALSQREIDYHTIRPRTLTMFLTYRCNSKCRTCSFWKRPQAAEKKREIGVEDWKRIVDSALDFGVKSCEIFGGNVLLRKDLLIPVMEYMAGRGMQVHMPTNQIGFDDEIALAVYKYVHSLYISIDGLGDKQDEIRGLEGSFGTAQSAIEMLKELRRTLPGQGYPKQRLICNTTVSTYNIDNLEDITRYAIETGFDEHHLEPVGEVEESDLDDSLIDGLRPSAYLVRSGDDESILPNPAQVADIHKKAKELKRYFSTPTFAVSTSNLDIYPAEYWSKGLIPHKECYVERMELTVDPGGNLVACPFFNNYMLGNLLEHSLEELWNKKEHKRFRGYQNRGELQMCKKCILGLQRNPNALTSLKKIYNTRIRDRLPFIS